jgi:hypothetical protein
MSDLVNILLHITEKGRGAVCSTSMIQAPATLNINDGVYTMDKNGVITFAGFAALKVKEGKGSTIMFGGTGTEIWFGAFILKNVQLKGYDVAVVIHEDSNREYLQFTPQSTPVAIV